MELSCVIFNPVMEPVTWLIPSRTTAPEIPVARAISPLKVEQPVIAAASDGELIVRVAVGVH